MIKKLLFTMINICIILSCYCLNSMAIQVISNEENNFYIDLYNTGTYSNASDGTLMTKDKKNKTMNVLQKTFGYEGGSITKSHCSMRFITTIKIVSKNEPNIIEKLFNNKDETYTIQIGEDERKDDKDYKPKIIKKVNTEELKSIYGYNGESIGTPWNVVLIGGIDYDMAPGTWSGYGSKTAGEAVIRVFELYSGNDIEAGNQRELEAGEEIGDRNTIKDAIKDALGEVLGKLFMVFLELFRGVYSDAPQTILNTLQTSNFAQGLNKLKPWSIAYIPEDILADENKNSYVNYSEDASNEGEPEQKKIYIDADENGFKKDTPIPIIPVDLYSIATGEIKEFDVNFFSKSSDEQQSKWLELRNNITTTLLHIEIYLGAVFLIGAMIWHGVSIVGISFTLEKLTPEKKAQHEKGLNKIIKSILMLVGSIIIMNLCIYSSEMLYSTLQVSKTHEAPIRVILQDNQSVNIYSFSTNITGYLRYMSGISKVANIGDKFTFILLYAAFVIFNILAVICMFIRTIALMILSFMGPILAILHSINNDNNTKMTFQKWIVQYIKWTSIQFIFAISYKIVLLVCF